MQGRQDYQPELFSIVDIEKLVPKNHLLRKLDRVLDLSFIRELTAPLYCHDNGRPSVDPELYFRIQLLVYLYNIPSERRACEEVTLHLAYRWFCRLSLTDPVPDHSSLTKIRERLGEETFKKIFDHIVKLCIEKKVAKPESIMADGSLIKANAALNSMVERDQDGKPKDVEPPKYIIGQKYSNETHISKTDPDTKLAGKIHEPKQLRYKVHDIADRQGRVILDTHVTDGSIPEGTIFLKRVDYLEEHFGFKIEDAVGDRGYGYGENLQGLKDRGIKAFVPNFHPDVGETYDPELFKYDLDKDIFICPMGYELTRNDFPSNLEQNQTTYRLVGGHCKGCPMNEKCFKTPPKNPRGKRINVNIHHKLQAQTKLLEDTGEFKTIRGERQWKMEGLFAEGKNYHGLGRARYRRRHNMQIQAYMIANVQNVKRLIEAFGHFIEFLLASGQFFRKNPIAEVFRGFFRPKILAAA